MTDRRSLAANGRVAAKALEGSVQADSFVAGTVRIVGCPLTDLRSAPDGPRDRQLLLGAAVTVFEDREGWSFLQAEDQYVGYVPSADLTDFAAPTHFVAVPATHAYAYENFKERERFALSFGSRVQVVDERPKFMETTVGFIPKKHLRPISRPFQDPATVAQLHFGVPYLLGGNAIWGIDCSGLISTSLRACANECAGDSDLQMAMFTQEIAGPMQRGDLVFWKGHVGMMVDAETLLHANAHHMATVYEPLEAAILRIKAQGDGEVLARRRIN